MDRATNRRLLWSFLSSWVARLSSTIMQLVGVPVFLHFWSVPLYGNWIVVSSIPSYLSFSSVGFGSVAGNEMTMRVARQDHAGALRVFQSCWWLIVGLCAGILLLLSGALCVVPVAKVLRLTEIGEVDTRWILFYLGVSVLLGQLEMLLQSAYRAVGRNAFGSFCKSAMSLAAFAGTILSVAGGQGPRVTALVFACANVAGTLVLALMVKRDVPWIEFGWRHARRATIRALLRPALAFMGFPIGNALNLQGTVLAVSYAMGPTSVVIFGTARTVSRVALQMVQMVNATFEPEITRAFGAGNIGLLRTLHRRSCQLALLVSLGIVAAMRAVGPWFLSHWSGGHVPPSGGLLTLLLLVVIVYALWSTSSTVLTATNQHQRLAVYYVAGTSLTCALCYLLARWQGLFGAAASLLVAELVMNSYVLPASLRVTQDTLREFLGSMVHSPASLRPEVLLQRLSRARPGLRGLTDLGIRGKREDCRNAAIAVVEPQMEAVFHAPFNAALLHAVLLAYPEAAVSFRAFPEHARLVREILDEQAPGLAVRVEWRVVPFAAGGSLMRRWRQSGRAIREVLRSPNRSANYSPDRRERVLFCSLSRMQLLQLKRAMRRTDQVRAVLHGDLDQIERPPRERFPMRLFALERVLQRPHPAGLRYLLLGDSIRERVPERLRAALANSGVIDHPYHFFPVRAAVARAPVLPVAPVFGIFGNSGSGRQLEAVARAVKAVDPTIRFRLVGFVADQAAVERLQPFVEDVSDQPIARAIFLKRAEEITHALWLAPPHSFRLRASGTFFDALAYAKPLIYTANPYIDGYFARAPGIGTRCATTAAVPQAILEAAGGHTEAAYGAQRAAIERMRERFAPAALAGTLPAALAWD